MSETFNINEAMIDGEAFRRESLSDFEGNLGNADHIRITKNKTRDFVFRYMSVDTLIIDEDLTLEELTIYSFSFVNNLIINTELELLIISDTSVVENIKLTNNVKVFLLHRKSLPNIEGTDWVTDYQLVYT